MTLAHPFNPDKLKFVIYSAKNHQLPNLNFAQSNGEDPLRVQEFYEKFRAGKQLDNELVYVLRYEEEWIGFFSVIFTILSKGDVRTPERRVIDANGTLRGLLIHKIGIDQKYRCFGIGKYILLFCIGLGKSQGNDTQVKIIIFETTRSLAEKIYHPKYKFRYVVKDKKKLVWVYKKIC